MKAEYKYIAAELDLSAFNCPNCTVYAKQEWFFMHGTRHENGYGNTYNNQSFKLSSCVNCEFPTIWNGGKIIFPKVSLAPPAHYDPPTEILEDYKEASDIVEDSPRGAAALLRLCIQKLCKNLGQSGKNINEDIKNLVSEGLPNGVQKALDSVRVIGNESVHPGEMDLKDNKRVSVHLFKLVNFITEKMITEPKEIEALYETLPDSKLGSIKNRDEKQ